jgi:hypothetical protein
MIAGKMIGKIIANLIAFVSMFKMFDTMLIWIFSMIGLQNFGFGVCEPFYIFLSFRG